MRWMTERLSVMKLPNRPQCLKIINRAFVNTKKFAVGTGFYASASMGRGSYETLTFSLAEKNHWQVKGLRMVLEFWHQNNLKIQNQFLNRMDFEVTAV